MPVQAMNLTIQLMNNDTSAPHKIIDSMEEKTLEAQGPDRNGMNQTNV